MGESEAGIEVMFHVYFHNESLVLAIKPHDSLNILQIKNCNKTDSDSFHHWSLFL